MVVTDLTRALVVASIPLAAVQGLLSVWWIYAVAFLHSALTIGFDAANFAAVPSLVRREDLVTANGRVQAGYSIAKVGGPLLGGLLIMVVPLPMLLLRNWCSSPSIGLPQVIHRSGCCMLVAVLGRWSAPQWQGASASTGPWERLLWEHS